MHPISTWHHTLAKMSYLTDGKKPITEGPWGGYGGAQFNDGVYTGIRELVVVHGAAIDSIQIEYDKKGSPEWSDKHGGSGGTKTDKIKLEYPDEVLTSISGHYGSIFNGSPVVVRSLTMESNRAKYGPYGIQQGTYFSFPKTGGRIVGFHGRCGWYLDSIGVHLKSLQKSDLSNSLLPSQKGNIVVEESVHPFRRGYNVVQGSPGSGYDLPISQMSYLTDEKKPIPVGPWGGYGGAQFNDGVYIGIRELVVVHGAAIDSIQIEYDKKGSPVWSDKHGGSGGTRTDKIKLEYPDEVLTSISGHYGSIFNGSPVVVRSLTLESNRARYGPYGIQQGIHFSFPKTGGRIVGFYGRCGWYLDSIGVYLKSLQKSDLSNSLLPSQMEYNVIQGNVGSGYDLPVSQMSYFTDGKMPITVGPWGGYGGAQFDDGVYTGIRELVVVHGAAIDSIQIEYDKKGSPVWSDKHGGSGGTRTDKIKLEYPDEVLTSISGHYGSIFNGSPVVVRSLTLESNRAKYGPYGYQQGTHFSFPMMGGRIVGFHGRCGWYLDSIGVYIKSLQKSDLSKQFASISTKSMKSKLFSY